MRCPQGSNGLVKTVLQSYLRLPEVVSSHFFSLIDTQDKGYISADQFSTWMSAIYVSRLDEKLEFTFKILDFNKDKLVTAKDVHLLLSFIDVESLA
jgi:Ca2+-binding EF-hand superfamily protein